MLESCLVLKKITIFVANMGCLKLDNYVNNHFKIRFLNDFEICTNPDNYREYVSLSFPIAIEIGAKYYNSDISIWLSVDPMADKHPDYTPFAYCYNNPIMLVDPNGMDTVFNFYNSKKDGSLYVWASEMVDQTNIDGFIRIYSHAYQHADQKKGIQVIKEGMAVWLKTVEEFDEYMMTVSEDWRAYKNDGKKIVVLLAVCNFSGKYTSNEEVIIKNCFAKELSKAFEDAIFLAFDGKTAVGYDYFDENGARTKDKSKGTKKAVFRGIKKFFGNKKGGLYMWKNGEYTKIKSFKYIKDHSIYSLKLKDIKEQIDFIKEGDYKRRIL